MAIVKKWSQFTNRANLSDNDNAQVMLLDTTVVSLANQNQRTPVTQILRSAKNLSDVDDAPTALNHLGVDVGNGKLAVGTADGEIVGFEGLTYDDGNQRLIVNKLRINEFVPTAGVVHNDTSGNITSSLIVSSDVDINFLSGVNHGDFSTDVVINFPNPTGMSVTAGNPSVPQKLQLTPADATNPGVVTAGTQTIGGDKTFSGTISASNLSNTNTGNVSLLSFGVTPNPAGLSLIGQQLNLEAADATNPGGVSTGTQTFAGDKTFLNGIIPQSGTTTQKNAISSPSQFQLFGDTTLGKLCVYIGAAWQTITSV